MKDIFQTFLSVLYGTFIFAIVTLGIACAFNIWEYSYDYDNNINNYRDKLYLVTFILLSLTLLFSHIGFLMYQFHKIGRKIESENINTDFISSTTAKQRLYVPEYKDTNETYNNDSIV